MQPDLPWNVAGIAPEAREAARAAARREGLSVGEWLTRKILHTLADTAHESGNAAGASWRNAPPSNAAMTYRAVANNAAATMRDTEEMLARVSRSEDESQSAFRRIDDHLRNVTRRLDRAERSQAESNRAMTKATTDINIAAREQTQTFDRLNRYVGALSDRVTRIEKHAAGSGLRDAVKALHTGLTRLADQVSDTANRSETQIGALTKTIDSLAGRLAQARDDAETASQALRDQIYAMDERVRAIESDEGSTAALGGLRETLDVLSTRFSESEATGGKAMARLEESLGKLEARVEDASLDRRLKSIEKTLADLAGRSGKALEDQIRKLDERLEEADRQYRRDIDELRAALEAMKPAQETPQTADAQNSGFPPLPQPIQADSPADDGEPVPPVDGNEPAPQADDAPVTGHRFSGVQSVGTVLGKSFDGENAEPADTAESFIAARRRHARATAEVQPVGLAESNLDWGPGVKPEKEGGRKRYVLIGGIVLILLAALAAGALLFRQARAPSPQTAQTTQTPQIAQTAPKAVAQRTPPPAKMAVPPKPEQTPPANTAQTASTAPKPATASSAEAAKPAPAPKAAKPAGIKMPAAKPAETGPAKAEAAKPAPVKTASLSPVEQLMAQANAGKAGAETVLGLKYLEGDGIAANEAEAARWLERAAKQGQPVAEYRLGTLYERGHGVPADPKQAAAWYEAAAKQGNRKAMHNLAVAYAQGSGVERDYTIAAQWFAKAARLGLRDSQFNLAVLYERGLGVKQSLMSAYEWYAIAAAQGDAESKSRVAALSTQLSDGDRAIAQRMADSFKPAPLMRDANMPPVTEGP